MSKSTFGLRKAGLSALAVTLTFGAGIAGAGTAHAAAGDFTADSKPKVMQGADDQAAGDLNYEFANVFTTNTEITFTVDGNACDTQANIDKAIEYADAPAVSLTRDQDVDGDQSARIPTYTTQLTSSSTQCGTAGIQDVLKVTLTQPSSGDADDTLQIDLSDIAYNVGVDTALGDVNVTVDHGALSKAAANATVVNKSFMFVPLVAANPGSTGTTLGTATYSESTPGAYFATGDNRVDLTIGGGTFVADVTPTITVPTGYKVQHVDGTTDGAPKTTAASTYSFIVEGPSTLSAAQVTVSGLKYTAGATEGQYDLDSSVTKPGATPEVNTDSSKAVNVVNFGAKHRIGGSNRYETAAKLFNAGNYASKTAVLSGGQKFPDALSANYLAGEFNTGTLLTKANELPDATKNALIDNAIETVYITGGPAAVSTEIEDQIESMPVGGNVNSTARINVVRLAGINRYETNKRINAWVSNRQGVEDVAIMAAGTAPYDSLAGGPVAYKGDHPLVLTGGKEMDRGEQQQLIDLGSTKVVILGGTGVVSQEIENDLKADGYTVVRLAGDTRYETAAAIATWASEGYDFNADGDKSDVLEGNQGFLDATTHITNGRGFADALSAGPLAGTNGQPVLLSKGADEVGDGTADYLAGKTIAATDNGQSVDTLFALGLTGATSASMIEDAAEVLETK